MTNKVINRSLRWVLILALGAAPILAADPARTADGSVGFCQPWMSEDLHPGVRRKLDSAFPLAVERVRDVPACRSLFEDLGSGGQKALVQSLYLRATLRQENQRCRWASALAWWGSPQVRLCRSFKRLSDRQAAVVLIHEALHYAGMRESPRDPDALDSAGINQLVQRSCQLG